MTRRQPTGRVRRWVAAFVLGSLLVSPSGPDLRAQTEAPTSAAAEPRVQSKKPRLLVFLVVDQLRGDLLNRYADQFSGGLERLMEEGLSFSSAYHAHAHTETSPGHATLSTGVFPARAGIPGNAWREGSGSTRRPVYNVVDEAYPLVGAPEIPGASPSVLRREGLADWVRRADEGAQVVSISAKDRAAVLMAGKSRGEVYWFNGQVGRFVTSTYYRTENPSWLDAFNSEVVQGFRADSVWASTVPEEARDLSAPDTASFEGDGVNTFFPHRYLGERIDPGLDDFFLWFEGTPMLDHATLLLAEVAVRETGAGTVDGRTDFLSVSMSQTDRVGHAYGPLSRETMDNLLRLDRVLGDFLSFLDEQVGRENYVIGLSSDHGAMTSPERLPQGGGRRLTLEDRSLLEQALGEAARESGRGQNSSVASHMVGAMEKIEFVGPAYTHDDLASEAASDSMAALFRQSFVLDRPGGLLSGYGVEMWWAEGIVDWGIVTGTTHGSPFMYDRWVPLILVGQGIRSGVVDSPVRPMDLAPTLAWLAGISFPEDLDGRPLPLGGG